MIDDIREVCAKIVESHKLPMPTFVEELLDKIAAEIRAKPVASKEPVTHEFLASVGFTFGDCSTTIMRRWLGHESTVEVEVDVFDNGDNVVWVADKRCIVDATRADILSLVAALEAK